MLARRELLAGEGEGEDGDVVFLAEGLGGGGDGFRIEEGGMGCKWVGGGPYGTWSSFLICGPHAEARG
jgi:hypothetical protein